MQMTKLAGIALSILLAVPAHATTLIFSFSGEISALGAADRTLMPTALTETEIHVGDTVSGSVRFNTQRSAIDHDGIFFPGGQDFQLAVGGYRWSSSPGVDIFTQVVLGDDVPGLGYPTSDSFRLSSLVYGAAPFSGWSANPAVIFSYSFYDPTARMLASGDILDLGALGAFPVGGSASVGFNSLGGSTGRIVNASIGNLRAQLVDATVVPEPGTWVALLTGFAVLGHMLRRRASPSHKIVPSAS